MVRHRLIAFLVVIVSLAGGCIELEPIGDGNVPVVTLGVSNPAPQLNEEVILTCSVVGGDAGGVTFDFQPADGRLFVNQRTGTATLIIEPADIGAYFAYTCTATNENGTGEPSNEQVIIPTS